MRVIYRDGGDISTINRWAQYSAEVLVRLRCLFRVADD